MADPTIANGATALLESTTHIPIAQLTPLVTTPSTRSVRAIVTLTWPYSSATGSVAFLLVEPDFRLRRTRGQVRVRFSGPSAKAVAKAGIASGDEVILGLDGVEWVQDATPFATPGRGVEFELKFIERLLLQFRQEDSQEINLIDIDHPTPEPQAPPAERVPSPETLASPYASPYTISNLSGISARPSPATNNGEEWSSPAFTKRARISYGSMFEKEYDPFAEEDGSVREKGRKRTRLSSTWKYQSRSTSPEVEKENSLSASPESEPRPTPVMADEGCQTVGLDDGGAAEVLADFHKQATNVGSTPYGIAASDSLKRQQGEAQSRPHEQPADLPIIRTQSSPDIAKLQTQATAFPDTAQAMPSSPRLQPISSDALHLVSPLVTTKYGALFGTSPPQNSVSQISSFFEQAPTPVEETAIPLEGEQEDLYGASPAATHGQTSTNEFASFQDPAAGFNTLEEASNMQDQLLAEDHFGQWQAANVRFTPSGSQHPSFGEVQAEELQDGYYVPNQQEQNGIQNSNFSTSAYDDPPSHHYPDPEEVHYGQPIGHSWGSRSEVISYPDLPDPDDESEHDNVAHQALYPVPLAMSRSGSANSNAIDLREESDEDGRDEDYDDGAGSEHVVEEEEYEASENEEHEPRLVPDRPPKSIREENYRSLNEELLEEDEEGSVEDQTDSDRRLQDKRHLEDEEGSLNSQEEEGLYEEEIYEKDSGEDDERRYQEYPSGFLPDEGEEFDEDEDEGSYDEEMEDDGQISRPTQGEPVVIDLLSSDDEAAPRQDTSRQAADEDEESDSDEDMDAEDVPVPGQRELHQHPTEKRSKDDDDSEHFSDEEDEDAVNSEEDVDLPDTGDDKLVEDELSDDGNHIAKPAELLQDTQMAETDDALGASDDVSDRGSYSKQATKLIEDSKSVQADELVEAEVLNEVSEEMAVGEPEPEQSEKEPSHNRNALQEADGNRELTTPNDKDESAVDLNVVGPSGDFGGYHPPQPPSLFARMFNLDGANDEPPPSYFRPEKPAGIPKSEVASSELASQPKGSVDQSLKQANGQLPTPEATQVSLVKEASDLSATSIADEAVSLKPSQSIRDKKIVESVPEIALPSVGDRGVASNEDITADAEIMDAELVEQTTETVLEEITTEKPQETKAVQVLIEAHNTRSRARQQTGSVEPVTREGAVGEVIHDTRLRARQQNGIVEPAADGQTAEVVAHDTPRRSHRRSKSTSSVAETPQTKVPHTPKSKTKTSQDESMSAQTDRSMSVILNEQATTKGHDASVELAMSTLDSPVKQPHDLRSKAPGGEVKLKLNRVLRTELSEFTSLKVLRFHIAHKLDVLAIATTVPAEPDRAKGGPRHYQIHFNVTDQSIAPGGAPPVTEVRVFRPYKDALPIIKVGDGVLLRNFEVVSAKNRGFALQSTDSSSWAVFTGGEDEADVRGPPVEYGEGETKHIAMLRSWYSQLEPASMEKIIKANRK